MKSKRTGLFVLLWFLPALLSMAYAARSSVCTAKRQHTRVADFGKMAMPLVALGVSVYKFDWLGAGLSQVLAHGLYATNSKLERKIGKKRPCGCDGAFPSGHMIMYSSSASYLHYRYGWQYGLPAYIAALGFSYDRVRNKAHSWGDMLGTAAIVNLIAYVVTPRFNEDVEYLPCFGEENEKTSKKPNEPTIEFTSDVLPSNRSAYIAFKVKF
jgi:membrane-associated phospholipid phosphatase